MRSCALALLQYFHYHPCESAKTPPRHAKDCIRYLSDLKQLQSPMCMYSGLVAQPITSDVDETARFVIMSYDKYNCAAKLSMNDLDASANVLDGFWYRVMPTRYLVSNVDIIAKVAIGSCGALTGYMLTLCRVLCSSLTFRARGTAFQNVPFTILTFSIGWLSHLRGSTSACNRRCDL